MSSVVRAASSDVIVSPARGFRGSVMLPGDKSISHRYAMLAGFAEGTSRLTNFSTGADPLSSLACMKAMGAKVETVGKTIEVTGTGGGVRSPKGGVGLGDLGGEEGGVGGG